MTDTPRHFRIFLSSPGDVAAERKHARKIITDLPGDPLLHGKITTEVIAWEDPRSRTAMIATLSPQEAINEGMPKPAECDIVVVVMWSRIGTPLDIKKYHKVDGGPYLSGTEWEYENAIEAARKTNKPIVLVYRRTEKINLDPDSADFDERTEQYKRVKEFFNRFRNPDNTWRQSYTEYPNADEFAFMLESDLKTVINDFLTQPATAISVPEVKEDRWQGSPFPGLRAFTTADAPIYFGRGRETGELMRRVAEQGFVAVVGASGSGKSSLVGAGLIPRLKAGGLDSSGAWILPEYKDGQWWGLRFTPGELGDNPFLALAVKCAPYDKTRPNKLAEQLAAAPNALTTLCLKALKGKPEDAKMLVFIDQFEELFTLAALHYREGFINMLAAAAQETRLRLVVTVRSDFYDRCVASIILSELLRDGTFSLSAPDAFFLKDMIEKPVERAELTFEDGLAARMVTDTGSEAGALALLAFALDELYKAGAATHEAYETLGQVDGAIGTRAAVIFDELTDEVKAALPDVFTKLVAVNIEGTPTRRRANLIDFDNGSSTEQLVQALVEARLLVAEGDAVEVAHEALFRQWPRLTEWIHNAKSDLYLLDQVTQAAHDWETNGRSDVYLWKHERLHPVYQMIGRLNPDLDAVTSEFIKPELEKLYEAFLRSKRDYEYRTIIKRFVDIGTDSLPYLVEILPEVTGRFSKATKDIVAALKSSIEDARPFLLQGLKHLHPSVRYAVALAIGGIGDSDLVNPLIDTLKDGNANVVWAAVTALGEIGDARAVYPLTNLLQTNPDGNTRTAIASALGMINDKRAVSSLVTLIKDMNRQVRIDAIRSLEKIGDPQVTEALMEAAKVNDLIIRHYAINALAKIGDSRCQEFFMELLVEESSDNYQRHHAIRWLSKNGDIHAIKWVGELLLHSNDLNIIVVAAEVLALNESTQALEILKSYNNPDFVEFLESELGSHFNLGAAWLQEPLAKVLEIVKGSDSED